MLIIPAIDLRAGYCVRLAQGDFARETVFSTDPVQMARQWVAQGASRLHVVDLDGARAGTGQNLAVVREIIRQTGAEVQLGGGLRSVAAVEAAFAAGVNRVIIGTAAVASPVLVRELVQSYGQRILVGIDARAGKAAVAGWGTATEQDAVELAAAMSANGVEEVIYTDIQRDGMLTGPDMAGLQRLLATRMKIIASGGVANLAQIRELQALEPAGLTGVIIGRALYTEDISLPAAIRAAGGTGTED